MGTLTVPTTSPSPTPTSSPVTMAPTVSPTPTVMPSAMPSVDQTQEPAPTASPVTMGPATVFATQELDSTAFSVSVSVGAESTFIYVMAPINRWHSVGFGGTSMADNLNGFIY